MNSFAFKVCSCFCVEVYTHEFMWLTKQEDSVGVLELYFGRASSESPDTGVGNQTLVLCRSGMHSTTKPTLAPDSILTLILSFRVA